MTFSPGKIGNKVGATVGKWFFDRHRVLLQTTRKEAAILSKAGAFVRRRARSSIRQARRKRLAELNEQERAAYDQAVVNAAIAGRPKPKIWWFASSQPGEPPRSIFGLLRDHIYFVYDPARRSVVVGPAELNGTGGEAPAVLEFGGSVTNRRNRRSTIAPRPYMRPALEAETDNFPELFRNYLQ